MRFKSLFLILLASSATLFISCERRPDVTGVWSGMPTRINTVSAASDATAQYSFAFGSTDKNGGDISISALIDANQPVSASVLTTDVPYEVSVASTATINGSWRYEDDDDIIIALDPSTLNVRVDPHGVTFSTDILTATQQPQLDSLTATTAAAWQVSLTKAMTEEFRKFNKISDIKIHNGIMSCEIDDRDCTFRQTQN